ncbi:MAG: hypothetical protein RLP44_01530 [Aggregatilineales bacterium]
MSQFEYDGRKYHGVPHWGSIGQIFIWVENAPPYLHSVGMSYAIRDLVKYGSDAVPRLSKKLLTSKSAFMKRVAVFALREIGDKRALDALWTVFNNKEDETNPWYDTLLTISILQDERLFDELVPLLPKRDLTIMMAMGNLADTRAIPLLIPYIEQEEKTFRDIVHAVEVNPTQFNNLDELLEQVKNILRERKIIVEALGKIGGADAIQVLAKIVHAPEMNVLQFSMYDRLRCDAITALGKIDHPQAIAVLESALTHQKYGVRRMARRLLKKHQA